jgi:hypothetical protein
VIVTGNWQNEIRHPDTKIRLQKATILIHWRQISFGHSPDQATPIMMGFFNTITER